MHKDLIAASIISKDLKADHTETLSDYNLSWVFEPLHELNLDTDVFNTLVCAIIYSYHPNSNKVDLKHDGVMINTFILNGLKADMSKEVYQQFLKSENEKINEAKGNFLDTLSADWQFITSRRAIDIHSQTMRMPTDFSNITEEEKRLKNKTELSKLTRDVVLQRKMADELIEKLKKEYVITDERAKQDFGVSFVDENVKRDSWSWREFVSYDLPKLKSKNHMINKMKEAQN